MIAPYFPFYVRDWLGSAKVAAMTYEQQGIYLRLLCLMWKEATPEHGPRLPKDNRALADALGLNVPEWRRHRRLFVGSPRAAFYTQGGFLRHDKLDQLFARAVAKSKIAQEAALSRWRQEISRKIPADASASQVENMDGDADALQAHSGRIADAMPTHSGRNADGMPFSDPDPEPKRNAEPSPVPLLQTPTLGGSNKIPHRRRTRPTPRPALATAYPSEFEAFWAVYPRKVDKARAFRVWEARRREGAAPEDMERAARHYAQRCRQAGTEPAYIKHAATFLGPSRSFSEWVEGPPEPVPAGPSRSGRGLSARELMERALSDDDEEDAP